MNHYKYIYSFLLLLLACVIDPVFSQNLPDEKADFFYRHAVTSTSVLGITNQGTYLGFYGSVGPRYEYALSKGVALSTGLQLLAHSYGGSLGIPLNIQFSVQSRHGDGVFLRGGVIAQHGSQPFFLPNGDLRGRVVLGRRWFLEAGISSYGAYRYTCANGTYTCNGRYRNDGWVGNPGFWGGIGRYWN